MANMANIANDVKELQTNNIQLCITIIDNYKKTITSDIANMINKYLSELIYKPKHIDIQYHTIYELGKNGVQTSYVNVDVSV